VFVLQVMTLASGMLPSNAGMKFFFFGVDEAGAHHLVQLIFTAASRA
jgi:hypothetical protein